MKLVGRNFYDPTSAMVLQQHRLVVVSSSFKRFERSTKKIFIAITVSVFYDSSTICELIKCFIKFIVMLTSFVSCAFSLLLGTAVSAQSIASNEGMEISVVL